jgi:uncharacterized protein (DUF849 family)
MTSTWLEAAINGPWGRERQPNIPITVEECIEQGIACAKEGASIIHVHAFDPETEEQTNDSELYAQIIEGIRDEVDAIVYPTIPFLDPPDRPNLSATERFEHQDELGQRGLLECSVVDPGSVNFSAYEDIGRDETGFLYKNPEDHIRTGLEVAARYGSSPAYAIYEPGFLRLGAALADRVPDIGQPIYRFMFTEDYTFGYPPEEYALDSYLTLLESQTPDSPWMVSGLGVDITPLIQPAVNRGGHVRVGLEDAPLGSTRSNIEWVRHARREIEDAGGEIACADEVRATLQEST